MPVMPSVGDDLGRYRLLHELGRGGMGVVFAAHDRSLDREVAIKIIAAQLATDDGFRARFRHEALTLSRVESPHVVAVHDHGELDGCLYLVTQLVAGGDLLQHLRRTGPLAPSLAVDLVAQVLTGLADAHAAGVVHRDVKPSNVLLRRRNGRLEAVLCDFGIATTADSQVTHTGGLVGSFPYMAPERHQGETADGASDLYSVGCLMWHLLTGTPPYAGSDVEIALAHLQAPVPQLPPASAAAVAANRVLERSMAKLPADRYRSAKAMRADVVALGALLGNGELAMPDVTTVRHALSAGVVAAASAADPAPRRTRRRAALVSVAAAAALVLSGTLYAVVLADDDPVGQGVSAPATGVVTEPTDPSADGSAVSPSPSASPTRRATPRTEGPRRGRQTGSGTVSGVPAAPRDTPASTGSGRQGGTRAPRSPRSPLSTQPQQQSPRQPTQQPTRQPQPDPPPTEQPTQQPTPEPAPKPTWRCWDGSTAFAYEDCSLPTGRAGLRWVYGDIARFSCVDIEPQAGGRVGGISCTVPTSGRGKATVYFLEWTSVRAARDRFNQDADTKVWRQAWGYQYYWTDPRPKTASHARLYASLPFSVRIDAADVPQRDRAIDAIAAFRSPDRLRADPI